MKGFFCRRQLVFMALSDFADVLLTFFETVVSFVRYSEPMTSTIFLRKAPTVCKRQLIDRQTFSSRFEKWLQFPK